jgi:hypothetical protein
MPSPVDGARVVGASVAAGRSVTTPVQVTPGVAVAWQPYSLSLHMKENTPPVTLKKAGSKKRHER